MELKRDLIGYRTDQIRLFPLKRNPVIGILTCQRHIQTPIACSRTIDFSVRDVTLSANIEFL